MNLSVLLSLGVTLLGVVAYFVGSSDEADGASQQIVLLLVAGLLAAFRAVPGGPRFLPVAAVLSVAAALWLLDGVIGISETRTPGIIVVLLIMGILQMAVAVAALLFDLGVLKLPTPAPQPQGAPGQYGPPSGHFPPPPGQQPPAGQYGSPGAQTQYQPQPGQFPPPPGQPPGTPPGGYPQQS